MDLNKCVHPCGFGETADHDRDFPGHLLDHVPVNRQYFRSELAQKQYTIYIYIYIPIDTWHVAEAGVVHEVGAYGIWQTSSNASEQNKEVHLRDLLMHLVLHMCMFQKCPCTFMLNQRRWSCWWSRSTTPAQPCAWFSGCRGWLPSHCIACWDVFAGIGTWISYPHQEKYPSPRPPLRRRCLTSTHGSKPLGTCQPTLQVWNPAIYRAR